MPNASPPTVLHEGAAGEARLHELMAELDLLTETLQGDARAFWARRLGTSAAALARSGAVVPPPPHLAEARAASVRLLCQRMPRPPFVLLWADDADDDPSDWWDSGSPHST